MIYHLIHSLQKMYVKVYNKNYFQVIQKIQQKVCFHIYKKNIVLIANSLIQLFCFIIKFYSDNNHSTIIPSYYNKDFIFIRISVQFQLIYKLILQRIKFHCHHQKRFIYSMGNNTNNTVIEYWTKHGYFISYLFWDLKGRNRFPSQPEDQQITMMFTKCLEEIDISSFQFQFINQFTPKYKYRFVTLHKRKVAQLKKQNEIKKFSRQSYHLQIAQQAKTYESQKKLEQLQNLMKDVEINQISIKTSLMKIDKFIVEKCAQNEFLQIRGVERLLQLLDKSIKLNNEGTKISFSSQIQLLKFFRYFSTRFEKQFYAYIPKIKSYASILLRTYHPINTQIIGYCLSLLVQFIWRVEEGEHFINILQKQKVQNSYETFLSPFIESIIQSQSILAVYYNIRFINEIIASLTQRKDKQLLEKSLILVKYSLVLETVKTKLQTMQYTIEKTTFIAIYQKIFKHSINKQNPKVQKFKIDAMLQENYRKSRNSQTNLTTLHQRIISKILELHKQKNADGQLQKQQLTNETEIVGFLSERDRKKFNKTIFDTLTQMQKFYKLQYYLQNFPENESVENQSSKTEEMIYDRLSDHNIQTYFSQIKQNCNKIKCNDIFSNCLKKLQLFEHKNWKKLQIFILEELGQINRVNQQFQKLKKALQDKQNTIKKLLKQNSQLKLQNSSNSSSKDNIIKPSLNFQQISNKIQESNSSEFKITTPPLLPVIPIFNLANILPKPLKEKVKRKPLKQLKGCNYTVISYQKIKDSIFQQIDDSKVELDQNQICQFFPKNASNSSNDQRISFLQGSNFNNLSNNRITLPASIKLKSICLLKSDRARNIQIVLTKLKIPSGQLKRSLLSCSGKYSSLTVLESIQKILPTQEQQQIIIGFEGNEQNLGNPQKFIKQLISIRQYSSRIKALIFQHNKQEMYFETESKYLELYQGFSSLKNNKRLQCVLQNCLAIGNYLNGQNIKGGAWGFKIQTIQRLQQIKSVDGKMNAAFYLIKQVWKQYSYPIFDKAQIQLYQYLSKMPLVQPNQQLKQLQGIAKQIKIACQSKQQTDNDDKIDSFCQKIIGQLNQKLNQFNSLKQKAQNSYYQCASYFCEDGAKLSSDDFSKKMYQCILFITNTQKMWKTFEQKRKKQENYRATRNSLSYIQPTNPQNQRQRQMFKPQQRISFLSKISSSVTGQKVRSSFQSSYSSIFQIHKPSKDLNQLTQEQAQKQIETIQRQSLNKALQNVFRRRTIRIQNLNSRLSKDLDPRRDKIQQLNQQPNQFDRKQ